jgi:hypothetical protein
MRTRISITITPFDRQRLEAVARYPNTAQKHVWRAMIVLLSATASATTRSYVPDRQIEHLRLALAGTVYDGWHHWAIARQDPALSDKVTRTRSAGACGGSAADP